MPLEQIQNLLKNSNFTQSDTIEKKKWFKLKKKKHMHFNNSYDIIRFFVYGFIKGKIANGQFFFIKSYSLEHCNWIHLWCFRTSKHHPVEYFRIRSICFWVSKHHPVDRFTFGFISWSDTLETSEVGSQLSSERDR